MQGAEVAMWKSSTASCWGAADALTGFSDWGGGEYQTLSSTSSSSFSFLPRRGGQSKPCFSRCRLKLEFRGGVDDRQTVSVRSRMGRRSGGQNLEEETFGCGDLGSFKARAAGRKVAAGKDDIRVGGKDDLGTLQISDERRDLKGPRAGVDQGGGMVVVHIEDTGNNSRKIVAKITIGAPLEDVWAILTDYEHLADFIPSLAVSKLLEKRENGARLYQVGEQILALGVKFKAKAVVDCEEKPTQVHPNHIQRDINFETVEGDFQVFRGTWRMEQHVSASSASSTVKGGRRPGEGFKTILSYILVVQPKFWLPVALVEGRLTSEIKTNLVCVRDKSLQS